MLALSTQYLPDDPSGRFMWAPAILQIGGVGYELTENAPRDQLPELIEAVRRQGRAVVSVRNYCPAPRGLPVGVPAARVLSLVSHDSENRSCAVNATRESLELAARADGATVIVDVGPCGMPPPAAKIDELVAKNRWAGPEGVRAREFMARQRSPHAARALDALFQSLSQILDHADHLQVPVAVRNPLGYDHLPLPSEFERMLSEFRGSQLRTWYDVSHGRAREILGLESAFELRRSMSGVLSSKRPPLGTNSTPPPSLVVGYHLSDLRGGEVGLPAGEGEIDFRPALEDAPPSIPMVVVAPPGTALERVSLALEFARSLGLDGPPSRPWEDHLPIIGR